MKKFKSILYLLMALMVVGYLGSCYFASNKAIGSRVGLVPKFTSKSLMGGPDSWEGDLI